jgi:hypothetical protein
MQAFEVEEGKLANQVKAGLTLAPMLSKLDSRSALVDSLFARRKFADKDVGQLTIDTRSKPFHRVLEVLRLCGASRPQAEQFLFTVISESFANTVYQNKFIAVHLANSRTEKKNGRLRTSICHISTPRTAVRKSSPNVILLPKMHILLPNG